MNIVLFFFNISVVVVVIVRRADGAFGARRFRLEHSRLGDLRGRRKLHVRKRSPAEK